MVVKVHIGLDITDIMPPTYLPPCNSDLIFTCLQQEASFGIKIKDLTKDSITVSVKEETSATHTDTQSFTNTAVNTATTVMPCNCPSWIKPNTYVSRK